MFVIQIIKKVKKMCSIFVIVIHIHFVFIIAIHTFYFSFIVMKTLIFFHDFFNEANLERVLWKKLKITISMRIHLDPFLKKIKNLNKA